MIIYGATFVGCLSEKMMELRNSLILKRMKTLKLGDIYKHNEGFNSQYIIFSIGL
jgi:hypothetical protein